MYLVLPAELNRESTVLHFWMYYKNVVFPFAFQLPTSLKTSSHCWIHLLDHLQPLFIDNKNCTENVWHWHEYFIYMDHKWVWALESFSKATKNLKKSWTLDEDAKAKNHCFLWFFFPIPYVKELCGCLHYWTTEVLRKKLSISIAASFCMMNNNLGFYFHSLLRSLENFLMDIKSVANQTNLTFSVLARKFKYFFEFLRFFESFS